jgi:hypothetical protein
MDLRTPRVRICHHHNPEGVCRARGVYVRDVGGKAQEVTRLENECVPGGYHLDDT